MTSETAGPNSNSGSNARGPRDPVMRAFEVLLWMADADGTSWGLREIAKALDMHPSTLHRVMAHLEAQDFLRQDPVTGRYSLGLTFLRLALKAASRDSMRQIALPHLKELSLITGESAALAFYDPRRRQRMLAAAVDSPQPIRNVRVLGNWAPITGGSLGLAILAFLPDSERDAILAEPLQATTPNSITDRAEMERVLERIRRQGYALSKGHLVPGAVAVSAPIWNAENEVIASIGVSQPEQRFEPGDEEQQSQLVIERANLISEHLGSSRRITPG